MVSLYAKLPESPGIYLMEDGQGRILYVGKAGNLRRRVSSYFLRPHDSRIQKLVSEIRKIDYKKTETALEALILEAELIKKYKPPFNVKEKDDKSFLYVEITKDVFPRVMLVRGKDRVSGTRFGPFTSASSIREALRILRRIFPWSMHQNEQIAKNKSQMTKRPCFDYQIGLCPGTCIGAADKREYLRNIKNLKLFFGGKKQKILTSLEREMKAASKKLEFEKAEKLRRQIFALQHIRDIALITETELNSKSHILNHPYRIEGYDVSNISGTSAVGSMVVFVNGGPDRNEYRKFRIRSVAKPDDVRMMKEILRRRFARISPASGWPLPNLVLIDGGAGQINAAKRVIGEFGLRIPVVGIAKGPKRKRNDFIGIIPKGTERKILIQVRNEAHRFAISYHKKLRGAKSMT